MAEVIIGDNESFEAALKRFTKRVQQDGILAELLIAALNANGMVWKTSPAVTEVETVTLRWLARELGLPDGLFGIINDTASINSFYALAAAREALGIDVRGKGMTGRDLPPLKVYCSEHAHSSIERAALALGFGVSGVERVPSDDAFRMRAGAGTAPSSRPTSP